MTADWMKRYVRAGVQIGFVLAMTTLFPLAAPAQTVNVSEVSRKIEAIEKERRDIVDATAFIERELQRLEDPNTVVLSTSISDNRVWYIESEDKVQTRYFFYVLTGQLPEGVYNEILAHAKADKVHYRKELIEDRRVLEAKDERLHNQLSYYLNERARLNELKTGSQEKKVSGGGLRTVIASGDKTEIWQPAWVHGSWGKIAGAIWVWPNGEPSNPEREEIQTLNRKFTIDCDATSGVLQIDADNAYEAAVNGVEVKGGQTIEGHNLLRGENSLVIKVTNLGVPGSSKKTNPAGVIYKLDVSCK